MLQVRDLSVRYRGHYALQHVSFKVEPGSLVGIFGPNGAGKSTLVKAMLGLVSAAGGAISFWDRPLKPQLRKVAYVPQRSNVDWDYPATVWEVVMMARTMQTGILRRYSRQSRELAKAALERVGIWELRDRPIGALSGGQQQRVFIARSLAQQAELFFFDEPFVGVDRKTEDIIFDIFHELKADGKTVLVVSHDLGETLNNYDRILLLNQQLIAFGPKGQAMTPDNIEKAYGHRLKRVAA